MGETFGQRLLRLREAAGLTPAGLSEAAGVSRMSVSRWERDAQHPPAAELAALAAALGVSLAAFDGVRWPEKKNKNIP